MSTYNIYQIDAFTKTIFEGNPAGVVSNADGLTDSQMQSIARELNNSETAFIFTPTSSDHDVGIRFFTPTTEVPTCGHATISAHYVRALENNMPTCTVQQKICIGILPVDIIKNNSDYRIVMTQGDVEISAQIAGNDQKNILDALTLTKSDLDDKCPIQIVSTGHSKVIIGIKSRDVLNSLVPDFTKLINISKDVGSKGFFIFTLDSNDSDILTHGRMFAPAIGITEDPVTGNANGPLGAYLIHNNILKFSGSSVTFKAKQGEAIKRPGIVTVTVEVQNGKPVKVQVGGNAVVAFKTQIQL